MAIRLHNLTPSRGRKKPGKRLGRGLGSGLGAKSGRGMKGQGSRSGASGFQRIGMRKLMLSIPKLRGFKSIKKDKAVVNVGDIAKVFGKDEMVTPKALEKKGLIASRQNGVKILGMGDVDTAYKVQGCAVSKSAAEKITKAGGTIIA